MDDPTQDQKVAEAHREAIEPLWTEPLYEKIADLIPLAEQGTQLVAEARCGYIPLKIRERLDDGVRVIALDPERVMLDHARDRDEDLTDGIFFIPERVDAISYADGVFDASVCVDGIVTARQAEEGIAELDRVTVEGGRVAVAGPLGSSFQLFYDMLDEALRAHDLEQRLERIDRLRKTLLSPARMTAIAEEVGLEVDDVYELEWTVSFDRGREFLHAPLVRETFFPHWLGLVSSPKREQVVRYVTDAIDTYFHGRSIETNLAAGFLVGTVTEG